MKYIMKWKEYEASMQKTWCEVYVKLQRNCMKSCPVMVQFRIRWTILVYTTYTTHLFKSFDPIYDLFTVFI